MTVIPVMPERRCRTTDITMSDAMPFAQHFEARTTFPLTECLGEKFFMDVRGMLKGGDRINLVRYTSDEWLEVVEVIEGLRVRFVDNAGVKLIKTAEIIYSGTAEEKQGLVVGRGFKGRFVVRFEGRVIKDFDNVVMAEEFAATMGNEIGVTPVYYSKERKAA